MGNFLKLAGMAGLVFHLSLGAALAQESGKLKIATEGAYPPFNSQTADGTLVGFDVDIANALCAEMKVECQIVSQDWDGIIPALQGGKFDAVIASMTITEERKEKVSFTNKYYTTPLSLVAAKDSDLASPEPEALKGKTVGAQASTTQSIYADEHYAKAGADVKLYPTQDEVMADLVNQRLDAVVADKFVLVDWLKATGQDCCKMIGDLKGTNSEAGIAVRKDNDALRQKLNAAIDAIVANGTYGKINAKYFEFDIYGSKD